MISGVLFEMDHTSLSNYKRLCDLECDLKQTAFILLTQNFPLVGYITAGQRNTFTTLKISIFMQLFQFKTISSPLFVQESQGFERIPKFYQNDIQFVDQITQKHSLGLLKHCLKLTFLISKSH